jgi:indole-3-glycerol phosphate synthase
LIGINNRNLTTLEVDLNVTKHILGKNSAGNKLVVSESGINTPADLCFLRDCGAHAFLIGSAIMRAEDIEKRVKDFVSVKDAES